MCVKSFTREISNNFPLLWYSLIFKWEYCRDQKWGFKSINSRMPDVISLSDIWDWLEVYFWYNESSKKKSNSTTFAIPFSLLPVKGGGWTICYIDIDRFILHCDFFHYTCNENILLEKEKYRNQHRRLPKTHFHLQKRKWERPRILTVSIFQSEYVSFNCHS
jgi:hypothetical protein